MEIRKKRVEKEEKRRVEMRRDWISAKRRSEDTEIFGYKNEQQI